MRRVVVTGMGIISSLGNSKAEVFSSLRAMKSGISFNKEYKTMGLRSQISGELNINPADHIDRKIFRFMGNASAYAYIACKEAIADAGLPEVLVSNIRTGLVIGTGGASTANVVRTADTLRERGVRRIGPYAVTQTMASETSACLATPLKIKGVNYSMSSACSTSAHCIGHGSELIQMGKQDIVIAGGGEDVHWSMSAMFDAMGALSTKYNETPEKASRAYDTFRDGFVISGGGSIVILEEYEHAIARGANIYAELTGYGATSDGHDMVSPSGEGAVRCMQQALATAKQPVQYINAHGTSTPAGDTVELKAVKNTFTGDNIPKISSTKSLSGHALGAAGSNETIYSLLMMKNNFLVGSANIETLDEKAKGLPILMNNIEMDINCIMSNSFGFGGTNATLIFEKI
ncbi:MAG: beta-ketoacyl-ACP synthase I [Ostreibacterium sp.]